MTIKALLLGLTMLCTGTAFAEPIHYDFCTLPVGSIAARDSLQIWNAESVHFYTSELANSPDIVHTPWAGYPVSYARLTAERDRQRCGGTLGSTDRSNRLIGDLLADIMSRWLIKSTQTCTKGFSGADPDYGLCADMERIRDQDEDTLLATVDTTAVYLSSHMGMALVAVVFDDPFWNQEYPQDTHCEEQPCGPEVLAARLATVRKYKELYDANNEFLAENLTTVIGTLKAAGYIKADVIPFGASLASVLPGRMEVFRAIRNATFAAALAVAATLPPSEHPMVRFEAGMNQVVYDQFAAFAEVPEPLRKAEANARFLLANPAVTWLFRDLGSQGWQELATGNAP